MEGENKYKLLLHGARQVVMITSDKNKLFINTKDGMNNIDILTAVINEADGNVADGISILINCDGTIADIEYDSVILHKYKDLTSSVVNVAGFTVIPGLVDGHTHPVWAGNRVHEFAMKLSGASYMEIHNAGGGIHYTVKHTTSASYQSLYDTFITRIRKMLAYGSTTIECKSGYGLKLPTEQKMLQVLTDANRQTCVDLSITYCGAHAVPQDFCGDVDAAVSDIIEHQLPNLYKLRSEGSLNIDNIDIFCETGVYDVERSRRILQANQRYPHPLSINIHGDELTPIGAAQLGASLDARAISHLEHVNDAGIVSMCESHTAAVVLPTTAYMLRLTPPPVRRMIEAGVIVALGSDFNPNAYCFSMCLVMHLACIICHMSMNEALVAATLNAAYSLNLSDTRGSITKGKLADLLVINTQNWEHLIYEFGESHKLIRYVIKRGEIVVDNGQINDDIFYKHK